MIDDRQALTLLRPGQTSSRRMSCQLGEPTSSVAGTGALIDVLSETDPDAETPLGARFEEAGDCLQLSAYLGAFSGLPRERADFVGDRSRPIRGNLLFFVCVDEEVEPSIEAVPESTFETASEGHVDELFGKRQRPAPIRKFQPPPPRRRC